MNVKEIGKRINAHLERFEKDPKINKDISPEHKGLHIYYNAGAHASGRYVNVWYVSYRGHSSLTEEKAEKYLAWLDAGNVGHHWEALRDE